MTLVSDLDREPQAADETPGVPPRASVTRQTILVAGDESPWLAGLRELAGRKLLVVSPKADALTLVTAKRFDGVIATYADVKRSLELLRAATEKDPTVVALLRADGRELAGIANSFPVLPRVHSVEVLEDQIRTKFVAAAWKANPR